MCVYLGRERAQPQASPAIASRLARIPASSARLCIFLPLSLKRRCCRNKRKNNFGEGALLPMQVQRPSSILFAAVAATLLLPPSPPTPPGLIYGPCVRLSAESPRRIIRSAHTEGQRRGRPRVIQKAGAGGGGGGGVSLRTMELPACQEELLCNNKPHQTPSSLLPPSGAFTGPYLTLNRPLLTTTQVSPSHSTHPQPPPTPA